MKNKIILYCMAASILGITLIVGPLFAFAMLGSKNELSAIPPLSSAVPFFAQSEHLRALEKETYGSGAYSYSNLDVGILASCLFIALTVYLLSKRMV